MATDAAHPAPGDGPTVPGGSGASGNGAGKGLVDALVSEVISGLTTASTRSIGTRTPLAEAEPGTVAEALAVLSTLEQLRATITGIEAEWLMETDSRLRTFHRTGDGPGVEDEDVDEDSLNRSLASHVAMSTRTSPARASTTIATARRLTRDMPGLLAALGNASLPGEQVTAISQALGGESPTICRAVDHVVTSNSERLQGMGTRRTREYVSRVIADHSTDADHATRTEAAARGRHVRMEPLAHGMARITAHLRALDARRLMETITTAAASDRVRGAVDSPSALAADHLVNAVCEYHDTHHDPDTPRASSPRHYPDPFGDSNADEPLPDLETHGGLAATTRPGVPGGIGADATPARLVWCPDPDGPARGPRLEIGIIITDHALLSEDDGAEPAHLTGYGIIPARIVRDTLTGHPPGHRTKDATLSPPGPGRHDIDTEQVFYRRLYTHPTTGELVAMDARSRTFPTGLRRMITWRDTTCRTPWCNASPQQIDHIRPVAKGGKTTYPNGQGLCTRCNLAKEDGSWTVTPTDHTTPLTSSSTGNSSANGSHDREITDTGSTGSTGSTASTGTSLTWTSPHTTHGTSPTPQIHRPDRPPPKQLNRPRRPWKRP